VKTNASRSAVRRPRLSRRGGFTVIEIAVTTFVLALAIATSITTMQRAFASLDTARNVSTASNILQTEMETERLFTWTKLTDTTYTPTIGASYLSNPAVAGRFTISRTTAYEANHSNQVLQVTLTVTWRNYDGRSLSRSFTTYFTQGGLNDYYYTTPSSS
jgi:hypothetical protein